MKLIFNFISYNSENNFQDIFTLYWYSMDNNFYLRNIDKTN